MWRCVSTTWVMRTSSSRAAARYTSTSRRGSTTAATPRDVVGDQRREVPEPFDSELADQHGPSVAPARTPVDGHSRVTQNGPVADPNPARTVHLLVVGEPEPARVAAMRDLGADVVLAAASLPAAVRAGRALRRIRGSADQSVIAVVETRLPGPSFAAWLAARVARAPLVIRVGEAALAGRPSGRRIGGVTRFALRRADQVVTSSRAVAAALAADVRELAGRVVVEAPGVDLEPFRPNLPASGVEPPRDSPPNRGEPGSRLSAR